jgi:CBS domain containing-hemolysin-like protein
VIFKVNDVKTRFMAWLRTLRGDAAMAEKADQPQKFTPEQTEMLNNIAELKETRLDDIMVPRADILSVQQDDQLIDLLEKFETTGRSRLIVYDDNLDDPVGHVHMKDVLAFMLKAAKTEGANRLKLEAVDLEQSLISAKIIRPVLFVPPSMPAVDLLEKMQASRMHLALVIDEYGGTDGLVTLADIVESIIGDIDDERDEDETLISESAKDTYIADARLLLEELAETLGDDFKPSEEITDEVSTLGGYLTHIAGTLPVRGEVVRDGAFEFHVLDADPRRLKRIRIVRARVDTPKLRNPRRKDEDRKDESKKDEAKKEVKKDE